MFKICLLVFTVAVTLAYGYNGENQAANLEQQPLRNSFMKPNNEKWTNGFAAQQQPQTQDIQDGSYIRPQSNQFVRISQHRTNPNFRFESSLRSNGDVLPNSRAVNSGDAMVSGERANQRLLLPAISSSVQQPGGLSKSSNGLSSLPKADVQQTSGQLSKDEHAPSTAQVSASGVLPLSSINRLKSQSHRSSPYYYRHQTLEQMVKHRSAGNYTIL